MRLFASFRDLLDYVEHCPVCNGHRNVSFSVGPDYAFKLENLTQHEDTLHLHCNYRSRTNRYSVSYAINCKTNEFETTIVDLGVSPADETIYGKNFTVDKAYFYVYINAVCECGGSSVSTADIELDMLHKQLAAPFALDREAFVLQYDDVIRRITINWDEQHNKMMLRRYPADSNITLSKPIALPIFDLDFSDIPQLIEQLDTCIIFA